MRRLVLFRTTALPTFLLTENPILELPGRPFAYMSTHSLPPWSGEVSALADDVRPLVAQKYAVAVLAGTQRAVNHDEVTIIDAVLAHGWPGHPQ